MTQSINFTILTLELEDVEQACALSFECFEAEALTRQMLKNSIRNPYACVLAAKASGKVIGLLEAVTVCSQCSLNHLASAPDFRRQGVASALLNRLVALSKENHVSTITLEVRASNVAAQNLYRRFHFIDAGLRTGMYANPKEDAVVLSLSFRGGFIKE